MTLRLAAPCGIDCFNCELYETNLTDAFAERVSETMKVPKELLACKGCTGEHQCVFLSIQGKKCKTKACAEEHEVDYCFECGDFPCDYLMPLADGASRLPHNIKVFNLCTMKRIGVEAWKDKALDIRDAYFKTEAKIGDGGSKE